MKNILCQLIIVSASILFAKNTFSQIPPKTNIIIYCDLSDRLVRKNQVEIDRILLNEVLENFKNVMLSKYKGGQLWTNDKLSIHFNPPIAGLDLASSLEIDFSLIPKNQKLKVFTDLFPKDKEPVMLTNIDKLYVKAMAQYPKFPGSDLFSFVKNDMPNLINSEFENILIIISDGYIYMDKKNPKRVGNRLGHLEGSSLDPLRLEGNGWFKKYTEDKWGLLNTGVELNHLSVLVLEFYPDCINNPNNPKTKIRPLKPCLYELDILQQFWKDWFAKMGVENVKILRKQDNINPSKIAISNFIN